ncbi:siderophore-interacting protein [Protaetiibacter larvae]|uniref:Siderophore-interacting protein n=1 Tax=Protaetiibacter larvae TaxID=2592654 RepID=A0A5C1Y7P7_9MICO|nr:siderophore-interacting protein [Protaetiibacter larvae]QEO09428.1 siderophore-interacting protein [Protaetiibacter larvae]
MSFRDARKYNQHALLEVVRTERVTPHMVRVTVTGDDLAEFPDHGFDHWFRMFLPRAAHEDALGALPRRVDMIGYLQFLRMPESSRPVMRNYTVRAFRKDQRELDIDFVVHGDDGVAAPWARDAQPGERLAIIDQGPGYQPDASLEAHLLASDETGLPALLGILRDLPRHHRGIAYIEIPDAADAQPHEAPDGVEVRWLVRPEGLTPGAHALSVVQEEARIPAEPFGAYLVGEQALATGLRRWLVTEHKVPKDRITFVGYWRKR